MLLIGAYRSNEVDITHPLNLTIDLIRKETNVTTIEVGPLSEVSIVELVADTLKCEVPEAISMASLVYRKTLGNPFFIGQFIKSLNNDGFLVFENGRWQWNFAEIEALDITDNVVDLLMKELRRLPEPTLSLIHI